MFYVSLGLGVLFIVALAIVGIVKFSKKVINGEIQRNIDEKLDKTGDFITKTLESVDYSEPPYYHDDIVMDPTFSSLSCNIGHFDLFD